MQVLLLLSTTSAGYFVLFCFVLFCFFFCVFFLLLGFCVFWFDVACRFG